MIKCETCRTENLDSAQYCDECGTPLKSKPQENLTGILTVIDDETNNSANFDDSRAEFVSSWASDGDSRQPAHANVTNQNLASSAVSNQVFSPVSACAKLIIERGKSEGKEFFINVDEANIGRWDADNGIFPDVDLDAHDAEAKVSRRHAKIVRQGSTFLIEDVGSTNGTFVNRGRRLLPGQQQILQDDDEVIVGKTFLRFQIVG